MKSGIPSDNKIFLAASMIVDEYGDDALIRASQHYDDLLDQGDIDELLVWGRIVEAVRGLLLEVEREGETLH